MYLRCDLRLATVAQSMGADDDIDARILRALTDDGRISNLDLAGRVGLSPSACLRRVRELERRGVIRGYRAVLDPERMGRAFSVVVLVGLNDHSTRSQRDFEGAMAAAPEVTECLNVTGAIEYVLRVDCADLAAYRRFHADVLGELPQVVSITTHVIMGAPKRP